MNTKKQGDIGLGSAIAHFTSLGQTVSIPLTDSQDYDLIVDINGSLKKVQVKTSTYKVRESSYTVTLVTKGGNKTGTGKNKLFDGSKIDLLFIWCGDGSRYLIPGDKVEAAHHLAVGNKYVEYKINASASETVD